MNKLVALLGEEEAAIVLGLAVQTLRNWRSVRKGPPYLKLGRAIRYDPADLETYRENRKITPEAETRREPLLCQEKV